MEKDQGERKKITARTLFGTGGIRAIAGAMLVISGAAHLEHPHLFLRDVLQYRLIGGDLAVWASAIIPFIEIGVAALLFSTVRGRVALGSAAILFAVFFVAQWSAWLRGLSIDCGCFGAYGRSAIGFPSLSMISILLAVVMLAFYIRKDDSVAARNAEVIP